MSGELTEEQIKEARIELLKTTVEGLQQENAHLVATLSRRDKENTELRKGFEKLLQRCLARNLITSWYYNGTYIWEEKNEV